LDNRTAKNPVRILLIEDNPADAYLLQEALKHHGVTFEIKNLVDGEQGMNYVRRPEPFAEEARPDVIIIDLNLPKVEGSEVLRAARSRPDLANTPVVILTSSDSLEERQTAARLGATLYLKKPTNLDAFLDIGRQLKAVWENFSRDRSAVTSGTQ
jgi:chemotaxis family two-component system response regulator Rcp1